MTTVNESVVDRVIRIVAGIALAYGAWIVWPGAANLVTPIGIASLVLLVVGIIALVTGLVGYCPLYSVLGISTEKRVAG